jgi:hypothetical protein
MTTLLRQLQAEGGHGETSDVSAFHAKIFLGVNIVIVLLLILMVSGYCCVVRNRVQVYFRGQRGANVVAFERTVGQSTREATMENEQLEATEDESKEKRRDRLMESFLRNNVTKVCTLIEQCFLSFKTSCLRVMLC